MSGVPWGPGWHLGVSGEDDQGKVLGPPEEGGRLAEVGRAVGTKDRVLAE